MEFEIFEGKNGEYYFRCMIGEEKVLRSEGYTSKSGAENGVESVKSNLAKGRDQLEAKTTKDGRYFFNVMSSNGQVVATSKYFESEKDKEEVINKLT